MREAAELAEPSGALLEFDTGEGIGVGTVGANAEAIEIGLADQMRRVPQHGSDADIDARLAIIDRLEVRMRIGHVEGGGVSEKGGIVGAVGPPGGPRGAAGERWGAPSRPGNPAGGGRC